MKVAIVHDWLYGGGAEKVVGQLHQLYPDAPIYTGSTTDEWRRRLDDKVVTGWPNWWPFNKLRKFMPLLLGWWFRTLDLRDYDLIIISTGNGEAKQIKKTGNAKIVCYCHTPVHFYWRHYQQYVDQPGFDLLDPLARLGIRTLVKPLRKRDYRAAQKIDHWIANSTAIKADIKQFYDKRSIIIHPPVDVSRFDPVTDKKDYLVTVGRLVPYKHTAVIIDACNQLQRKLVVIGRGPELSKLQRRAGPTVRFVTNASDEAVADYLARAHGFVFAAHEDFGITPVEALAAGTPVIAYRGGGALDYINTQTGILFDEQTPDSLISALITFEENSFDQSRLIATANSFSQEKFRSNIRQFIDEL